MGVSSMRSPSGDCSCIAVYAGISTSLLRPRPLVRSLGSFHCGDKVSCTDRIHRVVIKSSSVQFGSSSSVYYLPFPQAAFDCAKCSVAVS
jgi:hypothetical protein